MRTERDCIKDFIDQSNDIYWTIDPSFRLTYANESFRKLFLSKSGKDLKIGDLVIGKEFSKENTNKWAQNYKRALAGESFELKQSIFYDEAIRMDSELIKFQPLKDCHGAIYGVACHASSAATNNSEHHEAEKIIDASFDVICSMDREGNFVKLSKACKNHWGYDKNELKGKSIWSVVVKEDLESTKAALHGALNGQEITAFKNRFKKKDGGIAYNDWSIRSDSKTNILYCVARAAQKSIVNEREQVQNENRLEALIHEGSDFIAILDQQGVYKYVSPTSQAILGLSPEDFIGKSTFDYIHSEDAIIVDEHLKNVIQQDRLVVEPYRFKNKDGDWRWLETTLTNMLANPAVKGIIANSRDITAQRKETQHLKLLETVVTHAKDIILISEAEPLDKPGPSIVYVNEAFTKLTGYSREEVIGGSPRILQGPKSNFEGLAELGQALRDWKTHEVTTVNYKKSGEEFWMNFTVIPVANEKGWFTHWFAIQRDVTANKNREIAKDLILKIGANFNESDDIRSALNLICKDISALGLFSFCEVWLTDMEAKELELSAFYKQDEAAGIFYQNSKNDLTLRKGQDFAGAIWEQNQSIIWEKKGDNYATLTRPNATKKAGIETMVGFPITYRKKFIGVLQFGTKSNLLNNVSIINVLKESVDAIGSELIRKRTEIELTNIFEYAPDMVVTKGFDGYIKKVNPYMCKLLGYTAEELKSKSFFDFLHPDDVAHNREKCSQVTSGTTTYNLINRYITKSGDIRTISWNGSPSVKDKIIFCIGKDITEEVKSARLLKYASQLSRIGSWELNIINNSVYWSDITYEIHELAQSFEPNLENAIEFYRFDFQELVKENISSCIENGTPFDFEAIVITAKGNEVWIRAVGRAEIVNGRCIRVYGSIQDINERKTNEIRLNSISNNLPGAIVQFQVFPDGSGSILHLSEGSKKLWGVDAESGMKDNALILDQIKEGGDYDKVKKSLSESMISLTDWHARIRSRMPNGKIKWLECLGSPRQQNDGSTTWDAIIMDITPLKETEGLLDSASELARVGSWDIILDPSGNHRISMSTVTKEILEVEPDIELSVEHGLSLNTEATRNKIIAALGELVEKGKPFDLELNLVSLKGNEIWIRCTGSAEVNNGQVTRIYGRILDIHSLKSAELTQIKLLEDKNRVLESIGDAFFAIDENWKLTYWNHMAEKLFKKSREDVIGKHFWDVYPEAVETIFYTKYHHALKTLEITSFEGYAAAFNIWLGVTVYPSQSGLSVFIQDITAKKEFNLKIQEANERFEKVAEATEEAIWDWDISDNKLFKGNGFFTLFGSSLKSPKKDNKLSEEYFYKEDYQAVKESLQSDLLNPKVTNWEFQYRIMDATGKIKTVIDKGIINRDATGKAIRMIGAIKDISYIIDHEKELLELNQVLQKNLAELEVAYKELEQFAYIASHDLQEPLRMVSSFMDQLKRKYGDKMDAKAHQYIDFAIDGSKRMKRIIHDILDYSKIGKLEEKPVLIDLNKIFIDYKVLRRKVIEEKKVVFRVGELPVVKTSKTPLVQVFHNLIDNAIKYSKANESPIIEISHQEKNNCWEFCIADNGIGIEKKYFEKIFIIFQRLHNRDKFEGTGIGLSVVKKQIESLGGSIWIESEVDKGSKFYFTIPKAIAI